MTETRKDRWQTTLELVEQSITAESFSEDLDYLREMYGDDPGLLAAARVAILTELFVEMIGLYAALLLPKEEISDALAEARQRLNDLDFESPQAELDEEELSYYEAFADFASFVFSQMGSAMETMFNVYIAEDYDPEANPNVLIEEALVMAYEDLTAAQAQISRAAATALHGQPLWWRWEREAYGPAAAWLRITATLVEDYSFEGERPLGPPEQAREDLQAIVARAKKKADAKEEEEEKQEPEDKKPAPKPINDLIDELIEGGEAPITDEQIALCQAHREEAIWALSLLASDEDMQLEDAPGEGYAPIRAVQLLGELEAAEAIPILIDLVADGDPLNIIYSVATLTLEKLGPLARDDVLTFLRYAHDAEAKTSLASILDRLTDRDDDEAYRLLVEVWEESSWDDGKAILGYPLVYFGGEEAAERIYQALAEEDLDFIDHNELVAVLEEAGMDAPSAKEFDQYAAGHQAVRGLGRPEEFLRFAEAMPEMESQPEELAEEYASSARRALMHTVSLLLTMESPDELEGQVGELLESVDAITFDDPPPGYPDYVLAAYAYLAESAGPEVRSFGIGLFLPLTAYLEQEFDRSRSPDDLIAAAREALPDAEQARQHFAEASALALDGKPVWELWPFETPEPISSWTIGFLGVRNMLEDMDQIPFDPSIEPSDLSEIWRADPVPPEVEEILDFLFSRAGDWIHPADRPDFAPHKSALIPQLVRIIRDPKYIYDDAPGGGWAPVLAIRVLGDIRAQEAADTLIWALILSEPMTYIHEAAIFSLTALGPAALLAVKRYCRYGRDVAVKATLAEVLGLVGQDDPEVFPLLKRLWETAEWTQNRRAIALAFGDLGDRRAEPLLREAMQDPRADALDRDYAWLALMELGIDAAPPPQTLSNRLRTVAPASRRVMYDELERPVRVKYTAWGEGICPDCGQLMIEDASGRWVHLKTRSPKSSGKGQRRYN